MKNLKTLAKRSIAQIPFVQSWRQNREYRVERALIGNKRLDSSNQTSVIHYSVNKAATQYTKRIMLRCGAENGLIPVRMSDYAWIKEFPYLFQLSPEQVKPYLHIFRPNGFLYTVFGGLVEGIPNLDSYRTLIMVRDPRDMLVSAYYSYSKSHAIPKSESKAAEFMEFRKKISNMSVDEYVIDMSENTRWRMEQYMKLQQISDTVCILKYEDMISDFNCWLDSLLTHCQWQISPTLREKLLSESAQSKKVTEEKTSSHRRQVTPGDHKRKLKDSTIAYLDNHFSDILNQFGYKIDER